MKGYDPKLRQAMAEIEEIMKKHDCGGFVDLHSKTHSEFKWFIEHPSWSGLRFMREGEILHIKLHGKSSKENTDSSLAMLYDMRDQMGRNFLIADNVSKQIEQHTRVVHVPFEKRINDEDRETP